MDVCNGDHWQQKYIPCNIFQRDLFIFTFFLHIYIHTIFFLHEKIGLTQKKFFFFWVFSLLALYSIFFCHQHTAQRWSCCCFIPDTFLTLGFAFFRSFLLFVLFLEILVGLSSFSFAHTHTLLIFTFLYIELQKTHLPTRWQIE